MSDFIHINDALFIRKDSILTVAKHGADDKPSTRIITVNNHHVIEGISYIHFFNKYLKGTN